MSNQKQGLSGMSAEELTQNLAMITLERLGLEAAIEQSEANLRRAIDAQMAFGQELSNRLRTSQQD